MLLGFLIESKEDFIQFEQTIQVLILIEKKKRKKKKTKFTSNKIK